MTAEDQENMPRWWSPRIETLLDGVGRILASVGVMAMIAAAYGKSADDGVSRGVLSLWGGAYACVTGLVMWGLATVIKELRRIRIALETYKE